MNITILLIAKYYHILIYNKFYKFINSLDPRNEKIKYKTINDWN